MKRHHVAGRQRRAGRALEDQRKRVLALRLTAVEVLEADELEPQRGAADTELLSDQRAVRRASKVRRDSMSARAAAASGSESATAPAPALFRSVRRVRA